MTMSDFSATTIGLHEKLQSAKAHIDTFLNAEGTKLNHHITTHRCIGLAAVEVALHHGRQYQIARSS
jgi:hypothetical protein